jgi:hypothetical protein
MMTKVLVTSRKLPCEKVTNERKLKVRNERNIVGSGGVAGRSFTAINSVKLKEATAAPWCDKLNNYSYV